MQPSKTLKQVIRQQVKSRFTWMSPERQDELIQSLHKDMTRPREPEPTIQTEDPENES